MNLLNFISQYTDQDSCKYNFKTVRDSETARKSIIDTDNSTSYAKFKEIDVEHRPQVIPEEKVNEMLPWVHIAISNAKRLLLDIHYDIEPQYLQSY